MKFKSGKGNDQLVPLLVQIWFNFTYDTNTLLHYITPLLVSHCYYYKHLKVTATVIKAKRCGLDTSLYDIQVLLMKS